MTRRDAEVIARRVFRDELARAESFRRDAEVYTGRSKRKLDRLEAGLDSNPELAVSAAWLARNDRERADRALRLEADARERAEAIRVLLGARS